MNPRTAARSSRRTRRAGSVAVVLAALVAGCGPTSGVAGPIATPASAQPSVVQSADLTPPAASGSPVGASPTPSPAAPATASPAGSGSPTERPPTSPARSAGPTAAPTAAPVASTVVRAYFLVDDGTTGPRLVPVLRSLPKTLGVARAALDALLAGPSASEKATSPSLTTAVPSDARLLAISIDPSGVATVDLGSAFARGATTSQLLARYAQVVYTVTQFGNVSGVVFEAEGAGLAAPDDDGGVHHDPVDRSDYRDLLPPIFVDRPAYGAAIGNPARVTGLANVFEATFRIRLIDGGGRTLVDRQAMATCGSGCWGTFDVTLPYSLATAGWGRLRVYDLSARDGSPENVREEPVWLTPAAG